MSSLSSSVGREALRSLTERESDPLPVRFDLSDNTNAWGAPPSALRTLQDITSSMLSRYPSPYSAELRVALADYAGVAPDEVVTGCGSDDLIDIACRTLAEPGDQVAIMSPSFVMARIFATTNGLRPALVPVTESFDVNVDAILATSPSLVYLCLPNNPTATTFRRSVVDELLERWSGIVFIDEAYAEFVGESFAGIAPERERIVVLRTLSKAWGLAGMRVGYAVASRAVVREFEKVRGPYKVNAVAERAALSALTHDRAWLEMTVQETIGVRDRFMAGLRAAGFNPLPSMTNFVCLPVPDARAMRAHLLDAGIAVRAFPRLDVVGDAVRITVGQWDAMEAVLEALAQRGSQ